MQSLPRLRVLPDDKIVEASHGESVLEALLARKIELDHSCGGNGTCGTCRIFIVSGLENLPPRNEIENEFADERGFAANERLACQTVVIDGLVIQKP